MCDWLIFTNLILRTYSKNISPPISSVKPKHPPPPPQKKKKKSKKKSSNQINGGHSCHKGNRENDPKNSLSGKTQGIWKVCQNTGKKQGIWFGQVVNSLILKVKDIAIFAAKISNFFQKLDRSDKSVLCM